MARSTEQRHRLLWSELVSQLVCRENVDVKNGDHDATGYVDREPGRFDVPTGRIAVMVRHTHPLSLSGDSRILRSPTLHR